MSSIARRICTLCAICFAGVSAAFSAEPQKAPYELVRTLQMLQENIARGSATAQQIQRKLLPQMAERFLSADADVWKDEKNVTAALVYVLSGGSPEVLRTLIERGSLGEARLALAKGTLAYAEGRSAEASALLAPVDARILPAGLGGYVALAQAVLIGDSEPKKAIGLLDTARLLMPGTLVEEAALRREILVAVKDGDIERFERLSRQQLARFHRSLYAVAFRSQFSDAVVRLDYGEGQGRLTILEGMLEALAPAERRDLYLQIARKAVIEGRTAVARFASEQASRLTPPEAPKDQRPELYGATALIVTEEFDSALKRLKLIDGKALPKEDAHLLKNALDLAARLREWPKTPVNAEPERWHSDLPRSGERDADNPFQAIVDRAGKAISRADEDLKAKTP